MMLIRSICLKESILVILIGALMLPSIVFAEKRPQYLHGQGVVEEVNAIAKRSSVKIDGSFYAVGAHARIKFGDRSLRLRHLSVNQDVRFTYRVRNKSKEEEGLVREISEIEVIMK